MSCEVSRQAVHFCVPLVHCCARHWNGWRCQKVFSGLSVKRMNIVRHELKSCSTLCSSEVHCCARLFSSNDGSLPETLDFHGLSLSRLRRWVIFRQEWSLQVFNLSVRLFTSDALVHKGFVSRIMLHQFLALLLLQFWNFGMTSVYTQIPFI